MNDDIQVLLDRIAAGNHTEADMATLQRVLLVGGEGNVIQVGKYNVHIGEGQDIRIGDTIYQGPDAAAIRAALRAVLNEVGWQQRFGVPFQAPPLPAHFVPRPETTDALKARLLADASGKPGVLVVSAIHGLGGIGKSTLVTALSYSPDIQARFPDGILWATLGQQPEQLALLSTWIHALGDYQFRPTTVDATATHLRTLLHDKAALLVVDDVWNPDLGRPFLAGGPRCQVLITTRRADVADELGADLHELDVMTPEQSLALLAARLGRALEDAERPDALSLAKAVGYLPLALELAAVRVRAGSTWAGLRLVLEGEVARLEALEGPRGRRGGQTRLKTSLNLSLDALRRDDETAWRAFAWLGVLPEDVFIAAPMAATLWNMSQAEAGDVLQLLWNDALLLPAAPMRLSERSWPVYRMHDLLHDLARQMLTAPDGLGYSLVEAHRTLVKAYRRTQTGTGWATAPDDGYLYDHLVYHLDQLADHEASAVPELQSLFANDAWLQVRVSGAGYQYDGYLADLDVVWWRAYQETLRQIDVGEEPAAFAECVRYALISTSINSLSSSYEPALVARAIEVSLWTDKRAISMALRIPDPEARAKMLTSILTVDSISLGVRGLAAQAGLAAALAIQDEGSRVETLAALAPQLSGEDKAQALAQGLDAALAIEDDEIRAQALAVLAPQLSGEDKAQALAQGLIAVLAIQNEWPRVDALAALAPQLSGELLAQGLTAALAIQNEWRRLDALTALAPQLWGEDKAQALAQGLTIALAIQDEWWYRTRLLAALAPQLSGEDKAQALAQGLTIALAIQDEWRRVDALTALAPQLSGDLLAQGLTPALAIQDEWYRVKALAALAPQLSGEDKEQALAQGLAAVLAIQNEWRRVEALAALAPQLSGELLAQGLTAVLAIQDEWRRVEALAALAGQLSGEDKAQAIAQGLTIAPAIQDEWRRVEALTALASQLSGEDKAQALAQGLTATLAIEDEWRRADALTVLAIQDEEWYRVHAPAVLAIQDELYRLQALTVLAIQNQVWRCVKALAALVPQLSGDFLAQGLTAALAIQDEWRRVEALAALAPQLSGELLAQGLAAALAIQDEGSRVEALAVLAPQLSGEDKAQALAQGLTAALAIQNAEIRAQALAVLAPQLSGEDKAQALAQGLTAALAIRDEWRRAELLSSFLPVIQDKEPLLRVMRLITAYHLWNNIKYQKRGDLLLLLSNTSSFNSSIFDTDTLSKITVHIAEICQYWIWL